MRIFERPVFGIGAGRLMEVKISASSLGSTDRRLAPGEYVDLVEFVSGPWDYRPAPTAERSSWSSAALELIANSAGND